MIFNNLSHNDQKRAESAYLSSELGEPKGQYYPLHYPAEGSGKVTDKGPALVTKWFFNHVVRSVFPIRVPLSFPSGSLVSPVIFSLTSENSLGLRGDGVWWNCLRGCDCSRLAHAAQSILQHSQHVNAFRHHSRQHPGHSLVTVF